MQMKLICEKENNDINEISRDQLPKTQLYYAFSRKYFQIDNQVIVNAKRLSKLITNGFCG
jgi:hypothetical protein